QLSACSVICLCLGPSNGSSCPQSPGNRGCRPEPLGNISEAAGRRMNATTITPGRNDMTADTLPDPALPKPPSMTRLIVAVTLAHVFCPTAGPTVSLRVTFGAFGLAYVVRPLGAIVVGGYTDRAGRKA